MVSEDLAVKVAGAYNMNVSGRALRDDGRFLGIMRGSLRHDHVTVCGLCTRFVAGKDFWKVDFTDKPFFYGTQEEIALNCNNVIPTRLRLVVKAIPRIQPTGSVICYPDKQVKGDRIVSYFDQFAKEYVRAPAAFYQIPAEHVFCHSRAEYVEKILAAMRKGIASMFADAKLVPPSTVNLQNYPASFLEEASQCGEVYMPRCASYCKMARVGANEPVRWEYDVVPRKPKGTVRPLR